MAQHDRLFRILPLLALAFLVLAPLTAEAADGTITGVTPSPPSPVTKGTTVKMTIAGSGICKEIAYSYGEGPAPPSLKDITLPYQDPQGHTYNQVGTYTLSATGVNKCTGQKSASLTVQQSSSGGPPSLAALCQKIHCSPVALLSTLPKIEKANPFLSNIRPGGQALIEGRGFGSTPGRLILRLQSGAEVDLTHLEWSNDSIFGHIPCNMVTLPNLHDQSATLRVVTKNGASSNAWPDPPAQFSARAVETLLPMCDVKNPGCATDASYNNCNNLADFNGPLTETGPCTGTEGATFKASHSNAWGTGWGAGIGTDEGTDTYPMTLANGWIFTSLDFDWNVSEQHEGWVSVPSFPKGGTSWNASVKWNVTPWDSVHYRARVHICGPPGVKWK